MSQIQITLDAESVGLLDATAAASALSREETLKAAIAHYSAYDQWFRAKVAAGEQAWAEGQYVSSEEAEAISKSRLEEFLHIRNQK